jgi:hypothetical protein
MGRTARLPEVNFMSLRHGTLCLLVALSLAGSACSLHTNSEPTTVARGQRFVSQNVVFDAFFADLYDAQVDLTALPEQERNFRKGLARELAVEEGATVNVLAERAAKLAQALAAKGTTLKLDIEGLEAVDEADTSAQMRVNGTLDGPNLQFAEAVTRTARSELKLLAHLNERGQSLQRLAARAAVLDNELERAFTGKDTKLVAQVRRNLSDAKLFISLIDERRLELATQARHAIERLASSVTTNAALGSPNEPPLITYVKPPADPTKDKATARKPAGAPPIRGVGTKSPTETPAAPAADFEP